MGAIFAAVAVGSALLSTMVGTLADRIGRKPFLILFPAVTALAALICAFTDTTGLLVAACVIGSFGRGGGAGGGNVGPYMPAEQSLLAASAPEATRTKNFGRLAFMSSFGALVGGLLAAVTVSGHLTRINAEAIFRLSFLATGLSALIAGALGLLLVETTPPKLTLRMARQAARGGFFPRNSAGLVYRLWLTNALNGAAIGLFAPFVSYWLFRRYGASTAEIGVLYAIVNVVSMASNLSAEPLARRFGLVRATVGLRIIVAALFVPMALSPNLYLAGFFYLLRMTGQRIVLPMRQSYVMGMAEPSERSRVAAISQLPAQATSAATPTLAGLLFDEVSLAAPFLLASVFQLLNAVTYYYFFRNLHPEEERESNATTPEPLALTEEEMPPPGLPT
jgi:MFS family permease